MISLARLTNRFLTRRSSQARSNLKNSLWGGVDFAVTTGSVFLLIPILLGTIGEELFGIMVIVNTMMGFSGVFSFGLGKATLKYVSDYRAKGEAVLMGEVVRTTLWLYCLTGALASGAIVATSGWLAESVFQVEPGKIEDASLGLAVGGLGFLSFLIFEVAENAFRGFESFGQPVIVRSVVRLLTLGGQIGIALAGFGLAPLVALQVVLYLMGGVYLLFRLRSDLMPELRLRPWISVLVFKEVFSYGLYTYIAGVFGIVRSNGELLLIGAVLGPSSLAIYTVSLRVLAQVHGLISRVYGFLFPYAAKLHANGETAELSRCYDQSTFQISLISSVLITPVAILTYPLLSLWLGPEMAVKAGGISQVMALRFAVFPLSVVNAYFLLGCGYVRVMSVITAVNAILSLAVTAVASYYFGLWGAAFAQMSVYVPIFVNRLVIEDRLFVTRDYLRVFVIPLIVIFPMLILYVFEVFNTSLTLTPALPAQWAAIAVGTLGFVAAFNYFLGRARDVVSRYGVSTGSDPTGPAQSAAVGTA